MFQLCLKKLPWDDFSFIFYYNQPTSWRSARPRAVRGEGQLPPWGPGVRFKEVRLYWKCNFPLFYCFEMSPSERSSAAVSSTGFDEGMLPDCFWSWITGSHYAAFMRWMSVLFPAMLNVSMTKTSKRQTGLNFLKPLGGCCCHFSVQQPISQTNQTWHCRPRGQSPTLCLLDFTLTHVWNAAGKAQSR